MKKKSVEIMQDKGPWNFTEEQIHEIQNEDVIAITKFYDDNFNVILAMAKRFVNRKKRLGDYFYSVEDLMQQVFVDIPHYNFSSCSCLYFDIIKGSFERCYAGGVLSSQKKYLSNSMFSSLDAVLCDDSDSSRFVDFLMVEDFSNTLEEEREREEKDEKIIKFLEKTMSSKKALNEMFCKIFTDVSTNQIKGDEYEQYTKLKKEIK